MPLAPVVYELCGHPLYHGERSTEVDPEHPDACLCGWPDYLACRGEGLEVWRFWLADGQLYADPAPMEAK